MKTLKALLRDNMGMTTLEMAMVLPVVILLLFGTMDMLRYVWFRNTIVAAAVDAAEAGSLPSATDDDIRAAALKLMTPAGIVPSGLTVARNTVAVPPTITVKITVDFQYLVLPGFIADLTGTRVVVAVKQAVLGPLETP
ncbi:TadE/TadG family type IV pilus assembly protein [Nitratidesulfovibrio sp. SRB-5]|uniref:TadE/TadG family type IV pilus assembly protein n=1 Tax=Nitratidesulfovibrio sp. SRB-5 TaxID=2872636 RepID=UPI001024F599|nr:TadE family protein [Nitratidesulfovibrio sp. SRB-5]MBZ2172281.1 pilus assembly protein [Nitratidesulfovibrio sp. SRB-5]RXF77240.1 pilus assembly protein [Desulfovibrio sp. DS-1]